MFHVKLIKNKENVNNFKNINKIVYKIYKLYLITMNNKSINKIKNYVSRETYQEHI